MANRIILNQTSYHGAGAIGEIVGELASCGLKKPILFYTYDRDTYQLLRGVHQDVLETAPGKVCDTFSGLIEALKNEDFDLEKTKKFADEYSIVLEEDSAAKIIDEVFGKGQESE